MSGLTVLLLLCAGFVVAECWDQQARSQTCEHSVTRSSRLGRVCKGALIFEDTFETLDPAKWSHEVSLWGGGNWEFQVYWNRSENSFVRDGKLSLHPGYLADVYGEDFLRSQRFDLGPSCTQPVNHGCVRTGTPDLILNPITSARVHTTDKFAFKYGRVEVNAKLPAGDWIWPAIWMMPQDSTYGGWPQSGEIDIMESRGNRALVSEAGTNIGVEQVGSAMHWGPRPELNRYLKTMWTRNVEPQTSFDRDFHRYQLEWTPEYLKFSVDDVETGQVTPPLGGFWKLGNFTGHKINNLWINGTHMAPFDQEFYLILNLAVGGTNGYFPDSASNPGGKPWDNQSPSAMTKFWENRSQWEPTWLKDGSTDLQVDYVRVWAL